MLPIGSSGTPDDRLQIPPRKYEASRIERSSYPGLIIHALSSLCHELAIRLHVSLLKYGSIKDRKFELIKACLLEVVRKFVQVLVIGK